LSPFRKFFACTIPAVGKPNFSIDDGKMEVGIGRDGEPGVGVMATRPAREIANLMLGASRTFPRHTAAHFVKLTKR
jgi:dihydroxyacetone kinase